MQHHFFKELWLKTKNQTNKNNNNKISPEFQVVLSFYSLPLNFAWGKKLQGPDTYLKKHEGETEGDNKQTNQQISQ